MIYNKRVTLRICSVHINQCAGKGARTSVTCKSYCSGEVHALRCICAAFLAEIFQPFVKANCLA